MSTEPEMRIVVVSDPAALAEHTADWEDLAAAALEPNPFYEPWMLLPALEYFRAGHDLLFVLIFATDSDSPSRQILCGFFPLQRQLRYKGFPCTHVESWFHKHCYMCTPLLRTGYGRECMVAFFDWLAENASLMQLQHISGEESVYQLIVDQFRERLIIFGGWSGFTRVCCRRMAEGDPSTILPLQKRMARKFRRLSELGRVEHLVLQPQTEADYQAALEGFLQLEASGWKGRKGSALACDDVDRKYFTIVGKEALRRNRFLMSGVYFDGRLIAQTCYFLAGQGAFAFKTSFDEEYAKFSPGVYLMREDLGYLLSPKTNVRWVDSCAWPGNPLWNGISTARRTILAVWFATGKGPGEFIASAWPLIRWVKRKIRKPTLNDDADNDTDK